MKERRKFMTMQRREALSGYMFILPWIIGFCLFFAYPLSQSIRLAFSQIADITKFRLRWDGLTHFKYALVEETDFLPNLTTSVRNTILNTPIVVVFSMFIAILLNRDIKFKGLFRTAFVLPVLLGSGVVMQNLRGNAGTVDFAGQLSSVTTAVESGADLTQIGLSEQLAILIGPRLAGYLNTVLQQVSNILWMSGIQIILFLGALQTIPHSYYEAAVVDGASEWEKFWKITLPLVMPTTLLVTVYTIIDYFTSGDNTVIRFISDKTFANLNLGYGSALSWMYFLVIGVILSIVFWILRRFVFYMGDK